MSVSEAFQWMNKFLSPEEKEFIQERLEQCKECKHVALVHNADDAYDNWFCMMQNCDCEYFSGEDD